MRVVLFVGHKGVGTGASWECLDEHELAQKAAIAIGCTLMLRGHQPFVVTGEGTNSIEQRVRLAECEAPDLAIACHFNAHDTDADGCEVLYHPDPPDALGFAMLLAPRVAGATGVRMRHPNQTGVVARDDLRLLNYMRRICQTVILEPLFLTSATDRAVLTAPDYWRNLASGVADSVDFWQQIGGTDANA